MPHPSRKIVGPMLRRKIPASPDEVSAALITPVGLRASRCVVDAWVNDARRRHGVPSTSAITGKIFRTNRELRKRGRYVTLAPVSRPSLRQRIARRIARLFRKH